MKISLTNYGKIYSISLLKYFDQLFSFVCRSKACLLGLKTGKLIHSNHAHALVTK